MKIREAGRVAMMVAIMSTEKAGRAVIDPDMTEKLKELGEILGHTSLSQTLNYVLRGHIELELMAAKEYQTIKARHRNK